MEENITGKEKNSITNLLTNPDGSPCYAPTFSIVTLGCKVNQYESDRIRKQLLSMGLRETDDRDSADYCIVNTCAVTSQAARKSRQALRRFRKISPDACIYAVGCAAEIPGDALANISDDIHFVNNEEKENLALLIASSEGCMGMNPVMAHSPEDSSDDLPNFGGRTRAFLKVQDGCNSFCSYCIIPYLRGRSRSRELIEVLDEMKQLEDSGFQEVVITGIHLGDYGKGLEDGIDLPALLDEICSTTKIPRIRLSSIEPIDFSFSLLDVMSKYRVICRHIHLPLQHGFNRILKLMNRKYSTEEYAEIVEKAVKMFPDIAITTDVMVGFPGETDEDFDGMCRFIEATPLFMLHCFPYSPRPGTKAYDMEGIVNADVKKKRIQKLMSLGKQKMINFLEKFVGREVEVLAEKFTPQKNGRLWESGSSVKTGILQGHTDNYLCVEFEGEENLKGKITKVTVKERMGEILYGERSTPLRNR